MKNKAPYLSTDVILSMKSTLIFSFPYQFNFTVGSVDTFNFNFSFTTALLHNVTWFGETYRTGFCMVKGGTIVNYINYRYSSYFEKSKYLENYKPKSYFKRRNCQGFSKENIYK